MYVKQGTKFNINVDISPEWIAERIIVMSLSRKCIDHAFSAWPVNLPRRDANEGAEQCSAGRGMGTIFQSPYHVFPSVGLSDSFCHERRSGNYEILQMGEILPNSELFLFQSLGEPDLRFPSPPTKGCSALHCLSCLLVNDERRSLARCRWANKCRRTAIQMIANEP